MKKIGRFILIRLAFLLVWYMTVNISLFVITHIALEK